MATAIC